jgi:hypothetical protein
MLTLLNRVEIENFSFFKYEEIEGLLSSNIRTLFNVPKLEPKGSIFPKNGIDRKIFSIIFRKVQILEP